jgi:uncharacterized protein YbcI
MLSGCSRRVQQNLLRLRRAFRAAVAIQVSFGQVSRPDHGCKDASAWRRPGRELRGCTFCPIGRRPRRYVNGDLVVCLLRGGFTRVEQTLREGGHGGDVIRQRMAFQEVMRERFTRVVEEATGRKVIGFMSGNQQDPDMICEVFVLAQNPLVID